MIDIYITGVYDNYSMRYFASVVKENGSKMCLNGTVSGSRSETEVSVIGIALRYAYENNLDTTIYTDFIDAIKWAKGEWQANAQRIKEYVRYVKRVSKRITVVMQPVSEDKLLELRYYLQDKDEPFKNIQNPFKSKKEPEKSTGWGMIKEKKFRVIIYNADGSILCDLDNEMFGGVLKDAVFFANWYEKQGNKVERQGF